MCEGCVCVSVYITAESARQPNLGCIIAIYDVSMYMYVSMHHVWACVSNFKT